MTYIYSQAQRQEMNEIGDLLDDAFRRMVQVMRDADANLPPTPAWARAQHKLTLAYLSMYETSQVILNVRNAQEVPQRHTQANT